MVYVAPTPRSLSKAYENTRWYNGFKLSELTEGNDDERLDGALLMPIYRYGMNGVIFILNDNTRQHRSITVYQNLIRLCYSRGILTGM